MIEEKYIILINRFLDNEITPEEKNDLDEFLSKNEEGARHFNEMLKISSYLSKDEKVVPSPNVKKNILNAIDHSKYIQPEKTPFLEKIGNILEKIDRKIVLSFCTGAAAVFLLFVLIGYPDLENVNTTNISGTIVNNDSFSNFRSNEYIIDDEKIDGSIKEYFSDDIISIDFDLISEEADLISINFNRDYLKFVQITNEDVQDFKFDLKSGNVIIETEGRSNFSLKFDKNAKIIPQNSITLTINEKKLKKK